MYFLQKTKRILALALTLCLILSNVSFADIVGSDDSKETISNEETTIVIEDGETSVSVTESAEDESTEKEEETESLSKEDKESKETETENKETETESKEAETEKKESDEVTNESTSEKDTINNEETETKDESIEKEEQSADLKKDIATESDATENSDKEAEENEAAQDDVNVLVASVSQLDDKIFGYEPTPHYYVNYHFVLPEEATDRGASWGNGYTYIGNNGLIERYYEIGEKYDETAGKINANGPMGFLHGVELDDILNGYELIGWHTDENSAVRGIKAYDLSPASSTPITKEDKATIDLYSVFELIPVTIEFDINDSSKGHGSTAANKNVFSTQTVHIGDPLTFLDDPEYTSDTISRVGYEFLGWSKEAYDGVWKNLGPTVSGYQHIDLNLRSSSEKFNVNLVPNPEWSTRIQRGNVYRLYAAWNPKVYKVKIHWPQFSTTREYTFDEYLAGCKAVTNDEATDQWMIYDNDFETIQVINHINNEESPSRYYSVISGIPKKYMLGIGPDPDCSDPSKILWTDESYWGYDVPEGEELHLYCILSDNTRRNTVNVKVDLDGGYHRYWSSYDFRQPVGVTYKSMLYPSLMTDLVKSGYVVDKIVKINSDGSETDFNFDQVASLGDRSDESNELLEEYDRVIAEATPLYEAYYEILKERMEKQKAMVTYGNKTWEEFIALPEIKNLMDKEKAAYAKYEEVINKLPDEDHAWDLRLRVKWKGKTIHSRFDYNGNRSGNYRVDPTTATMTSKDVTYGKAIGALPNPKKTGYTFKGWKTGRDLFTQQNWKDATSDTIFDGAEKEERFLFGYNYDERLFTFYADWEPITLNVSLDTAVEGSAPEVTINEFKFGEPTVLNVHGEYKVSNESLLKTSGLFGATDEKIKEAYGIEVLDDYYTDGAEVVKQQAAGTQYKNGDTVTLYKNSGENLRVKVLWRDKSAANPAPADTVPSAPSNGNNNSSSSSTSSSSSSSSSTTGPIPAVSNQSAVVQQTLQQTMSSGKYEKAVVNTGSLSISKVMPNSSTWTKDPNSGKWRLSGIDTFGKAMIPKNTFCQVDTVITKDVANLKAGDTVTDTYYFDASGNMVTGWMQTADNKWYFFSDKQDANIGKMSIGWTQVAGNWYYFTANGSMLVNGKTPDGLSVDANGVWNKI